MRKLIYVVLFALCVVGAEAVIVAGGDGTQNTSSPVGGQGWDYVGRIDHVSAFSSVTYISNNWFITAHHIKVLDNPTGVLLGGASYSIDPNSWTRLTNSVGGNADLDMFRVVGGMVGLAGLTVRSSATSNGSGLTMIGNGRNRQTAETHWSVNTGGDPWVWTEVGSGGNAHGYKWASGSTKRWGTNVKHADVGPLDDGFGITDMFSTDFDDASGEAQGATFDSGGGVFYNNGGDWELAGIMVTTSGFKDQPGSTAVYGNLTAMADMQYYAAQIALTAQIDDIDEDGIPDGWEYGQTGSTTGVVASVDQDGDGFTGEEEWLADTDPTDEFSFLELDAYTNAVSVAFSSSTNREYQVQYQIHLTNAVWMTEIDWFAVAGTQTVKAVSTETSNRFYRVRAKLP